MLSDILYRLRALFRRKTVERELGDELKFHLEHQVAKSMRAGLTHEEALREARMKIGGPEQVKEECRQARGVSLVETTLQDMRYAARMLAKSPGFTAAVALSLALGIGANTAIFSLIDAVMLRMLPVAEPEELAVIARARSGSTDPMYGFTYREYRRLREYNEAFADIAAYSLVRVQVSVDGSLEPTADGQLVTGAYFSLLGVKPAAGRVIGPEDDLVPNGHPVAMISDGLWKRRFARDPSVIGRNIKMAGRSFTIIGVTPAEFFGMEVGMSPDIFAPVMMQPSLMPASENFLGDPNLMAPWLRPFGRLKQGATLPPAAAAMDALWQQIPQTNKSGKPVRPQDRQRLILEPAAAGLSALRRQFSQPLILLMGVVGIVLLIACANTANLLLARAAARRPELAMRRALGAGRGRLIRQMLVEAVVLAILGGVAGILLARWATKLLVAFMSTGRLPIALQLEPDLRMLGFTAAASLLTGILFGLAPAIRSTRVDGAANLNARTTGGRNSLRPGKVLAVVQLSLSLVLLIGAGLFVRTLQKLNQHDAGFDRESVLMLRVEPRGSDQRGIPGASVRLDRIYKELLDRVQAIPGVRSATMAHFAPTTPVSFGGTIKLESGESMRSSQLMTYPNYFATMGIPILAGRDFSAGDLGQTSPLVAVVNEAFASKAFAGQSPVGKRVFDGAPSTEIIGLVKDSRYASLRGETPPLMYLPFLQTRTGRGQMTLHVRVAGDTSLVRQRLREEVYRIDNNLPMFNLFTLAEAVDAALIQEGLIATLSSLFSVLALLLACVGLYGLLSFGVVRRTAEMGIRMALGASRRVVVWMIMREAMVLVAIGIAISVPAAIAIARLASSQISGILFGLEATDPLTIAGAAMVMAAVALLAGYLPARRASRVDPMTALRNE